MKALRVLLVEDDAGCRRALQDWLAEEGTEVVAVPDTRTAIERANGCDVALVDHHLPDGTGLSLLRKLTARDPDMPVIMLTGQGSVELAIEAIQRGAFHYLAKPVSLDQLGQLVQSAASVGAARRRARVPEDAGDPCGAIVGSSPAMERVRELITKLGRSGNATVLITGESGTGKDLAARALHLASPRAAGPFTNITCTALPTTLLESELFGHERGAFTDAHTRRQGLIEQAAGGTVFLDEIGDMEPTLQAKLLRVLEDKRFRRVGGNDDLLADVRIVAATNVDLPAAVAAKRFREDLYYRLAVLVLHIPPLRRRREDIPALVQHFVVRSCGELGLEERKVSPAAMEALREHPWPGNVRELRNVIERAVLLSDGATIDVVDLQLAEPESDYDDEPLAGDRLVQLPPGGVDIQDVERDLVRQALHRTGGNITHAARLLGMSRDQIRYRLQKFGLDHSLA